MAADAALSLPDASALGPDEALAALGSSKAGLTTAEALSRRLTYGPNALRTHGAGALTVLARQFRSYLLLLLLVAAAVSAAVGELTEASIIAAIMTMSVGLGFFNEYRSEKAVEALHSQIRHVVFADRDGVTGEIDVTDLVPGDVVHVKIGDVVPADLRLLAAHDLECDESVLTGEARAAAKSTAPIPAASAADAEVGNCAFMGTIVSSGDGVGVVVRTGGKTEFGAIALRLGERHDLTAFQRGLQDFSRMLVIVTGALAGSILVINVLLGRSVLQSALFALAIAVGLTPQLLPAIVTVSLATGARRLARKQVIVKRLVCIEDLGNVEVLFTDKTGTLTEGHITFERALDPVGTESQRVLSLAAVCSDSAGNELDRALWETPGLAAALEGWTIVERLPFDHDRQLASVLADNPSGRTIVAKGAPEAILARCNDVPDGAAAFLDTLFEAGERVVAVASRAAYGDRLTRDDEHGFALVGFLCFADPPKAGVSESLARLERLGVSLKIVTGDNGKVAAHLCESLGLEVGRVITGADLAVMDDEALGAALPDTRIFARVSPEQKSRIMRLQRSHGVEVGFLGDGVNDAIALHDADVGISVESAVDVAMDAADVVLLTKDLGILAEGVVEGRRIFANTIKYVLMGTSSNFGNMFSAAGASLLLSFLPMLPTQILLNNLLYDGSELTIPTDEVDEEMLARPAQWDVAFIRRFMGFFGPISSLYDFLTFAVMLWVFDAGPKLFRSGWFVESLATQTLVIFVIRTRRVPFFRSRPSRPLLITTIACAALGMALPFIGPLADVFGFRALPLSFFAVLVAMIVTYLGLAELGKATFFRQRPPHAPRLPEARKLAHSIGRQERRVARRAARWHLWPRGVS